MERQQHWDRVYTRRASDELSWFETEPAISLRLLDAAGLHRDSCVLDVGGGDSRLVDALLARGLRCLTVLDISAAAVDRAKARLGASAGIPTWMVADVTGDWSLPAPVDVWHDRAVLHFLTDAADRARYVEHLRAALKPGGTALIATFAPDGPERCSGLPVVRYSPAALAELLGPSFTLVESLGHVHVTPAGVRQSFQYARFLAAAAPDHQPG